MCVLDGFPVSASEVRRVYDGEGRWGAEVREKDNSRVLCEMSNPYFCYVQQDIPPDPPEQFALEPLISPPMVNIADLDSKSII